MNISRAAARPSAAAPRPENAPRFACGNCHWSGGFDDLRDIKRYWERVVEDLDEGLPDGECPKCGALAYREPENG